ncbi:hypothetical protein GUJ93_ZPchr0013g35199 [Zizania palustris]|uniref:Uncharacterized protein n=1 Tax=Zizania palustris TaxID=103762 RepID=A0A8J5WVX3_ZIZPA|nr:hypothetical protein GUJ93_ZPchr0013g35199 [Zizania palustris]
MAACEEALCVRRRGCSTVGGGSSVLKRHSSTTRVRSMRRMGQQFCSTTTEAAGYKYRSKQQAHTTVFWSVDCVSLHGAVACELL